MTIWTRRGGGALGRIARTAVASRRRLPLYPGKRLFSYLSIVDAVRAPTVSVTDYAHKIAATRLGNRLRVAGTAELSGSAATWTRCVARC